MPKEKSSGPTRSLQTDRPKTVEEEERELLSTAQQQVRPVIKREVEGEPITKELLNLRLKKPR
jgi:hypothetical protein